MSRKFYIINTAEEPSDIESLVSFFCYANNWDEAMVKAIQAEQRELQSYDEATEISFEHTREYFISNFRNAFEVTENSIMEIKRMLDKPSIITLPTGEDLTFFMKHEYLYKNLK